MSSTIITKNSNFLMKTLLYTSDPRRGRKCSRRSRMDHWRNYTRSARVQCAVVGCVNEARDGAHVISVDRRTDRQWWIAPMSGACNHPDQ
jgi:hypothetical protein